MKQKSQTTLKGTTKTLNIKTKHNTNTNTNNNTKIRKNQYHIMTKKTQEQKRKRATEAANKKEKRRKRTPQSPMGGQSLRMKKRYRQPSLYSARVNYYMEREKYIYGTKPEEDDEEDMTPIQSFIGSMIMKKENQQQQRTKQQHVTYQKQQQRTKCNIDHDHQMIMMMEDEEEEVQSASVETNTSLSSEESHGQAPPPPHSTELSDEESTTSSQENPHYSTKSSKRTLLNDHELTQWQYFKRYYQQLDVSTTFLSKVIDRLENSNAYLPHFSTAMMDNNDIVTNVRVCLTGIVVTLNQYMSACEEILKYLSYHYTTSGPLTADAKLIADPYQLFPNLTAVGGEPYDCHAYIAELDTIESIRVKCGSDPRGFYHFLRMNVIVKLLIQMEHLFNGASKASGRPQIFTSPAKNIESAIRNFRGLVLQLQVQLSVRRAA